MSTFDETPLFFRNNIWQDESKSICKDLRDDLVFKISHCNESVASNSVCRYASTFKFLKMWSYHNDCSSFIRSVWSNQAFGSPMQILSQKLKRLKDELKVWNKNIFGDIHNQVKATFAKVDDIQQLINISGYSDELMHQEKLAKIDLENVLNIEEVYWKEKAKIKWHCDGDRNTAFFHRTARIKQAYKKISYLRIDDTIVTEPNQIASHVVTHFTNLFTGNNDVHDNGLVDEVIPHMV